MTEKQEERVRAKIKKIRSALSADKRFHGGYFDDSRGLRYMPPELYLRINDYKGAARYFKWFDKNFPDDIGYGMFWFEYAISSFKNKKMEIAEKSILKSFMANDYLIEQFLGLPLKDRINNERSEWHRKQAIENFLYSEENPEFAEFSIWLKNFIESSEFLNFSNKYVDIEIKLKTETEVSKRSALLNKSRQLLDDY
ncbi:hypothetical protein [Aequorivita capsosiphonis]|uniref:hypothetical protein n=1 Tax=Aequorivita capsosiphonis TaxID=487317 RepID=UPI00041A554D|nr:hypothetical protein [Aequorivita capsosiphonis]